MKRLAALLALAVAPLTATPASAGCLEDYTDGTPTKFRLVDIVQTVELGPDYSVTVRPGWAIGLASGQAGRTVTFVDCVT